MVRHGYRRDPEFGDHRSNVDAESAPKFRSMAEKGLVEQHEPRLFMNARARADALRFAGERRRSSISSVRHLHPLEHLVRALVAFDTRHGAIDAVLHVLERGQMREQRERLKNERHVARLWRYVDPEFGVEPGCVPDGDSTCLRSLESGNRAQGRAFAGTDGPNSTVMPGGTSNAASSTKPPTARCRRYTEHVRGHVASR